MLYDSGFPEMSLKELEDILGLTIKKDNTNKVVTFLGFLSAFTEDSQLNISFNSPSSSGKTHIVKEISNLFPKEDVIKLNHCSPTAFFHDHGEYDEEKNECIVNLCRKIIIFFDQANNAILIKLRPLLSQDVKRLLSKITDKNKKGSMRTKNTVILGFPSFVSCSASYDINEQESTRMILLGAEINQSKLKESITATSAKEADKIFYKDEVNNNMPRRVLMKRISAIRNLHINNIIFMIDDKENIDKRFFAKHYILRPRHQRDITKIYSLIKAICLLNPWHRDLNQGNLIVSKADVEAGFALWDEIGTYQDLGISPYIFDIYKLVLKPLWEDFKLGTSDVGVERGAIIKKHCQEFGSMLDPLVLRQQILPRLEAAGLIKQVPDKHDKRVMLVYPTDYNNSESDGGND